MKKINYYIALHNNTKNCKEFDLVSGWTENLTAPDGTEIQVAMRKSKFGTAWFLDELSTGYSLDIFAPTRKEVLENLTDSLLQKIANLLKQDEFIEAKKQLEKYKENLVCKNS